VCSRSLVDRGVPGRGCARRDVESDRTDPVFGRGLRRDCFFAAVMEAVNTLGRPNIVF